MLAQINKLSRDFKSEINQLSRDFKSEINQLSRDFKSEINKLSRDLNDVKSEINNLSRDLNDVKSDIGFIFEDNIRHCIVKKYGEDFTRGFKITHVEEFYKYFDAVLNLEMRFFLKENNFNIREVLSNLYKDKNITDVDNDQNKMFWELFNRINNTKDIKTFEINIGGRITYTHNDKNQDQADIITGEVKTTLTKETKKKAESQITIVQNLIYEILFKSSLFHTMAFKGLIFYGKARFYSKRSYLSKDDILFMLFPKHELN
jgi:hypothetical protein